MKQLVLFFLFFLLCCNIAEAQTNANIPCPENVLVVYNSNSGISDSIKNYYRDVRNIPASNIVPLDGLASKDIIIDGSTHRVIIAQNGDIIQDSINATFWSGETRHAWKYFLENVSTPIRNWITSHNLTSTIRYIVLCKGIPFKIQAGKEILSIA